MNQNQKDFLRFIKMPLVAGVVPIALGVALPYLPPMYARILIVVLVVSLLGYIIKRHWEYEKIRGKED